MRGLDPTSKAARMANYVTVMRKELLSLARVCGVSHPGLVHSDQCEILDANYRCRPLDAVFDLGGDPHWGLPAEADRHEIARIMQAESSP